MYETWYGLREKAFRKTPDPRYLFLNETYEEALEQLSPSLRKIALLTIEGQTQADIAARLNCSRRTIIRKLELIRETLAGCLD